MRIELHCHTDHSKGSKVYYDGVSSPEDIVLAAKRAGLDAVCITDHNKITGALAAKKFEKKHGVRVFVGEEISTASGHMLAIGINERIEPGMTVPDSVDAVHDQGGIAIAAHPFDLHRDGMSYEAKHCDAMEIFNAMNIDRFGNGRGKRYAARLKKPGTVGSDAHADYMVGHAVNICEGESVSDLIKAVKKDGLRYETRYIPIRMIMQISVDRLNLSYDYVNDYIENNYTGIKKAVSKRLLRMVKQSPGRIDNFFRLLAYVAFAGAVTISLAHDIKFRRGT